MTVFFHAVIKLQRSCEWFLPTYCCGVRLSCTIIWKSKIMLQKYLISGEMQWLQLVVRWKHENCPCLNLKFASYVDIIFSFVCLLWDKLSDLLNSCGYSSRSAGPCPSLSPPEHWWLIQKSHVICPKFAFKIIQKTTSTTNKAMISDCN